MAVYVDEAQHKYGRMVMCHMIADTPNELHDMARRIGVARKWFQDKASFPHYDICKAMREKAIKFAAIEVDRRGLFEVMKVIKQSILDKTSLWEWKISIGWQQRDTKDTPND